MVEAYEILKRIRVETISENTLQNTVNGRLKVLVDTDPDIVAPYLAQFAHDNVHNELSADNIWRHLEKKGIYRRHWNNDPHVIAAANNQNKRYLSRLEQESVIPEQLIWRDEVQTIFQHLTSKNERQGILISGVAGIGKSMLLFQIIQKLQEINRFILAFRITPLIETPSPKEIGRQLELPENPACVLASIANGNPCVLVIDQLDELSEASGRKPHFFECIYEIIKEAQVHRNMCILVACRKFDIDNDSRFRKLLGSNDALLHVNIPLLSHEKIRNEVAKLNIDPQKLHKRQLEILSIPLYLKLFSEIVNASEIDALDFNTEKDLYAILWTFPGFA